MNSTRVKRRLSSSSSSSVEKENNSKWLPQILLKRVKVEPSDYICFSDSSPTEIITPGNMTVDSEESTSILNTDLSSDLLPDSSLAAFLTSLNEESSNGSDETWLPDSFSVPSSDSLDESSSFDEIKNSSKEIGPNFIHPISRPSSADPTDDVAYIMADIVFSVAQVQDKLQQHAIELLAILAIYYALKQNLIEQ